jgi:hypothetical protein
MLLEHSEASPDFLVEERSVILAFAITKETDACLVWRDGAVVLAARLQSLLDSPTLTEAMGRRDRATIEARFAEEMPAKAFPQVRDGLLQTAGRR